MCMLIEAFIDWIKASESLKMLLIVGSAVFVTSTAEAVTPSTNKGSIKSFFSLLNCSQVKNFSDFVEVLFF